MINLCSISLTSHVLHTGIEVANQTSHPVIVYWKLGHLLTYLLTYAHRSQWSIGHQRPAAIALYSGLLLSFRTSWSPAVSPPTVARPASFPLPLRVPCQGLACSAGCWLPEGVSDPASLPPQYLLGHWFLESFISGTFMVMNLRPRI